MISENKIKQLNLKRGFLQEGYLTRKYERGYVKNPNTESFVNDLCVVLDETYRGLWDIQFEITEDTLEKSMLNRIEVIINYPKVKISNSRNQELDIEDLYVKIPIHIYQDKFYLQTIQGCRGARTVAEQMQGYSHSHLRPEVTATKFEDFCTGTGEINILTAELNARFDLDMFKLYLLHLENFVAWESIEGNPYMNLTCVNELGVSIKPVNYSGALTHYYDCFKLYMENNQQYSNLLQWTITDGLYKIIDDYNLDKLFRLVVFNPFNIDCQIYGVKNSFGDIITQNNSTNNLTEVGEILFQGVIKPFKLIREKVQEQELDLFLNPSIKNYIIKTIEDEYNKKSITNYIFRK